MVGVRVVTVGLVIVIGVVITVRMLRVCTIRRSVMVVVVMIMATTL